MQGDHLSTEKVLAIWKTLGDSDALETAVGDNLAGTPVATVVAILLDLEPDFGAALLANCYPWASKRSVCRDRVHESYHPPPIPVSVKASSTFFMYASVGPL